MRSKRQARKTDPEGKLEGKALTHMRDAAFGSGMTVFLHRVNRRQGARDDSATQSAAEAKRQRKAERNKALALKGQS